MLGFADVASLDGDSGLLVMVISLVMVVLLTVSAFAVLEIRPLAFARLSHLRAVSCADGCVGFSPAKAFGFVVPVLVLVFLHITPRSPPPCEKTKRTTRALCGLPFDVVK